MLTAEQTLWAFQAACIAVGFLLITEPGQILSGYGHWLDKNEWRLGKLYKPLGGCGRCFAGQVGFWIGAAIFGLSPKVITFCFTTLIFHQIINRWLQK
jgi:hypothetical protein